VEGHGRYTAELYNSQDNAIVTEAGNATLVLVKEGDRTGISRIKTYVDTREQRAWLTD
jgi:hypothetical protein